MRFEYLRDVVTLRCDPGNWHGCGMCGVVCPWEVLSWRMASPVSQIAISALSAESA